MDTKWTVEKVEKIQKIIMLCNPASLDQPMANHDFDGSAYDAMTLAELVPATDPGPEEMAIKNENKELLLRIINKCLQPREVKIIMLRFGFESEPMTLDEIGKIFHVTRERIRQVEAKALIKIRRYMKSHEIYKRSEWNVD